MYKIPKGTNLKVNSKFDSKKTQIQNNKKKKQMNFDKSKIRKDFET